MVLPDTQIAVALDNDDDADYEAFAWDNVQDRVVWSEGPREDSLGAKYNRAQALIDADLYVLWADDMVMPDKGWDEKLRVAAALLPSECGIVLFGSVPGVLAPGLAVTRTFVDAMGFFCQPFTPVWWHETWTIECASMADCVVEEKSVRIELLQPIKGKSQSLREISFWGQFFDTTRSMRRSVAEGLIRSLPRADNLKAQLLTSLDERERRLLESNKPCSDPENAKRLEAYYSGGDARPDARYLRLKAAAEDMLCQYLTL